MCGSSFQDLLLPIKLIDIDGDKLRLMFVFVHFTIFSVVCSLRNFHIIRGPTVILTTYISVARFGNDAVTTGVMNRIAEINLPSKNKMSQV